ncbi:helix-turn-helix domain-containing protein, partial [bacterium]
MCDSKILKVFGQRIKRLRIQRSWSQDELGQRAGLHRTYIGSIERSERNISLLNIERIARALNVPVQLLVVMGSPWGMDDACVKGELCPGMHVGGIYKDKSDKHCAIVSHMLDSLKRNQKCVCVVTEDTRKNIVEELARRKISAEKCAQWGQFILLSYADAYLKDGKFHSERMAGMIKNMHQDSLQEGFKGLRVVGDLSSGLVDFIGHKNFIAYEARVNYFFPDTKALGMCLYDESEFSESFLLDVIYTHPKLFFHGKLLDNPYYKHPAIFLDPSRQK